MRDIKRIEPVVPRMPKRKRVAAYARVSTDTEKLLHSLSAQISYYSNLIQKNPEWEYAGVYADEGISGTGTARRKEFLRLISDCEDGKIDLILVKSLSRMARNTVDLLNTVRHLKEIGVEVRFEKENISTFTEDGEFLLTLLASFAQCESENLSGNIKWGKRKGFAQGNVNGVPASYGYRWENGELVIVPEEAALVKRIYHEYLGGKARTAIASGLNAEGLTTRTGIPWEHTSIRYILSNPVYVGDILLQKTYMPSPLAKTCRKNKGELPQYLVQEDHEPIIDRETYAEVQAEQKRRSELGVFAYDAIHTSCFTQKLECGRCHSAYRRKVSNKRMDGSREIYWVCSGSFARKRHKNPICTVGRFLEEEELRRKCSEVLGLEDFVEEIFLERVDRIAVEPEKLTFQLKDGKTIGLPIQIRKGSAVRKPPTRFSFWTGKIRCSVCGRNYVHQVKHHKDGGTEPYWICGTRKTCEGRRNGALWENIIEDPLGKVKDDVEFISAGLDRRLVVYFKDGSTRELPWPKKKNCFRHKGGNADG